MKTEEVVRPIPRDYTRSVSRALLELSPRSCVIVDTRGNPVPLSLAGYVLRFGEKYYLQVRMPFEKEEIERVRIDGVPDFATAEVERFDTDRHGRAVRSITFQVKSEFSDLWSQLKKFGVDLRWGELSVVTDFKSDSQRECRPFICPVVVRPRWSIVAGGVLAGIVLTFVESVLKELFFADEATLRGASSLFKRLFLRPEAWYLFLTVAGVTAIASYSINICRLYYRSKELRAQFRDNYTLIE